MDFISHLMERRPSSATAETAPASEAVLRRDWDSQAEDDDVWTEGLELARAGFSHYQLNLEDYEQCLDRGEIQW